MKMVLKLEHTLDYVFCSLSGLPPKFFVCGTFVLFLLRANTNLNRSKNKFPSLPPLSFLKNIFISLFLATLRLHCCAASFLLWSLGSRCEEFSSCSSRLTSCGSQALEHGWQLWCTGLIAPRYVGYSPTRDWTDVPCIGRQILNHWTTREVLTWCLFIFKPQYQDLPGSPVVKTLLPLKGAWVSISVWGRSRMPRSQPKINKFKWLAL